MKKRDTHWTERSPKDFQFRIASDFVLQLESRLDALGWTQSKLAEELGVTEGRVSQIINNPGNLSLNLMVKCVRALHMKLAVVAYDDGDHANERGPVNAEVFRLCWERLGRPLDFWSLDEPRTQLAALTTEARIGERLFKFSTERGANELVVTYLKASAESGTACRVRGIATNFLIAEGSGTWHRPHSVGLIRAH